MNPTKPFDKYAWPGRYPLYALMHDGEAMCIDCANAEPLADFSTDPVEHHGWKIDALDVNWEDTDLYCCQCNRRIESAYGEDNGEEGDSEEGDSEEGDSKHSKKEQHS